MFARNLIKETGRRVSSFKVCLECTTTCTCIETKSCAYNDFKYTNKPILKKLTPDFTEFEVVYYYK